MKSQHVASIPANCYNLRKRIKTIENEVRALRQLIGSRLQQGIAANEDVPEEIANTMLAVRHLEDARMRLGKVIQAFDGGTSCYDK